MTERAPEQAAEETAGRTMVAAIDAALARAMADDDRIVVLGEDVGVDGGVFRATEGLLQRFGPDRVIDTPLSETAIAGVAVGLAAQGFRPVVEIQFMGFALPTVEQIAAHAARMRNRTRGRLSCPLVLRTPHGGGVHAPEHHSEALETVFAHFPGLRVVVPSSPERAYRLLLASIADPDPVIFLEPTRLYRAQTEPFADDGVPATLDRAITLRAGVDVTVVAWGAMTAEALNAAEQLAGEGIDAEVVDLQTLKPIDMETVAASVERTGRCVITHEAARTLGLGAEVAARLAEGALLHLLAPIERVAGYDTVMPLPKLEARYLPGAARIVEAARRAVEYA